MSNIIKRNSITLKDIEWVKTNKSGRPLPIEDNFIELLKTYNITIRMNDVTHKTEITGFYNCENDEKKQFNILKDLCVKNNFITDNGRLNEMIYDIATDNNYNPFLDELRRRINKQNYVPNQTIIDEVFNCLPVNSSKTSIDFYKILFTKWCLNVVRQCENTLSLKYSPNGVLILQGGQGARKTTFCEKLMPNTEFVKVGHSLNPDDKDSIIQGTRTIITELGEMDSTLKSEQARLKSFFTNSVDTYRAAYDRVQTEVPRTTTFIGTVNKSDFLKDETGNRRYWIIPLKEKVKIDIDTMEKIDMWDFWATIYYIYKNDLLEVHLKPEEEEELNELNRDYNEENDVSIAIDEFYDWDEKDLNKWYVRNIKEIREDIGLQYQQKRIKNCMERKGIPYKQYKVNGRNVKGYMLPPEA